jgi:hypothetical protein
MRPSSAFARRALSIALLSVVSCAAPKLVPTDELPVTLEGEIALAGAEPLLGETIVLSDAGGGICTLTSPTIEYELRNLAGQAVRVTGRILGETANGPEFLVESYELMPVNGKRPIIGTLESRGGLILIQTGSGREYRLDGPLAEALQSYAGYKVWVSGQTISIPEPAAAASAMTIESYGILGPPAAATDRTP